LQANPETFLQGDLSEDFSEQVEALMLERKVARQNKDYAASDRIRDTLKAMNVIIEDGANGTTWRKV